MMAPRTEAMPARTPVATVAAGSSWLLWMWSASFLAEPDCTIAMTSTSGMPTDESR